MRSPRLVLRASLPALLATLALTACHGEGAGPRWPRSAGAITPDDPADDGGESLEPHRVGEAAAVEHGGDDITVILDEPPAAAPTAPTAPTVTPGSPGAPVVTVDPTVEGVPVFEEIIIVE